MALLLKFVLVIGFNFPNHKNVIDFAKRNNLHSITYAIPPVNSSFVSKQALADDFKLFNKVSLRMKYIHQDFVVDVNQTYSSMDMIIFITQTGNLDQSMGKFKELMEVRDSSSQEFYWLDISQMESLKEVHSSLTNISLDLDDNVLLFNVSQGLDPRLQLWEAYKIHPSLHVIVNKLEDDGASYGKEQWTRRRDLKGFTLRGMFIHSPPFITLFEPEFDRKGSYIIKGICAGILYSLQVNPCAYLLWGKHLLFS